MNMQRLCFVTDESGHWYCIPVSDKELFEKWAYDEIEENSDIDFDDYRLNMHVSKYSFEKFGEIEE